MHHKSHSTRRATLLKLGAVLMMGSPVTSSFAQQARGQQALRNRMLQSLPVLPWLELGETTLNQVRPIAESMINSNPGKVLVSYADSAETGGTFMSFATASKSGLLDDPTLQIFRIDFDERDRAQMLVMMFDRGWKDKNVQPILERITRKLAPYTAPIPLTDADSEATDKTYLYDIGKFAVELRVPQFGSYVTATFTTKVLLRKLRTLDRSIEMFKSYLDEN